MAISKQTTPRHGRKIRQVLHTMFGVDELRDGQRRVIDSVLSGRDTLAVMPTGSGKSLCYQVPAALLPGATIVVSPLIALMKDQLEKLEEAGYASAAQLNSSLTRVEEREALEGLQHQVTDLVFCTPERLINPDFLALLKKMDISLLVVDEAHCISQWGHDFRPAYLEIGAALDALGRPPLLALTATATDEVIDDIGRQLGTRKLAIVNTGIYRPNLHYRVLQVTNADEKLALASRLVRETAGVGIVYAATVKAAEQMYQLLAQAGESVALYHGKLSAAERTASQNGFMRGDQRVMVATNAFGMGIDKSDTRFVIHLQVPANLEAYYQESGRAGRDGRDAECTLLYFHDDKRVQQFFLGKHYPGENELRAVYDAAQFCSKQHSEFSVADLKAALGTMADSQLKICLKMLKDARLLKRNRKLAYLLAPGEAPTAARFAQMAGVYSAKQERDRDALEQMVAYAQSGYCRWKLLLEYFNDLRPGFEQCCTCDNCTAPPAVIEAQEQVANQAQAGASEQASAAIMAAITVGSQVKVPRFDIGTVLSVAGDRITIEFPENSAKTFMAEFVQPI